MRIILNQLPQEHIPYERAKEIKISLSTIPSISIIKIMTNTYTQYNLDIDGKTCLIPETMFQSVQNLWYSHPYVRYRFSYVIDGKTYHLYKDITERIYSEIDLTDSPIEKYVQK